jgi:hypothetical protein
MSTRLEDQNGIPTYTFHGFGVRFADAGVPENIHVLMVFGRDFLQAALEAQPGDAVSLQINLTPEATLHLTDVILREIQEAIRYGECEE